MTTQTRPGWLIGGASVRGAAHLRNGRPNEDAVLWTPRNGAGTRIVGAVSDGHGASAHFRSEIGARLAVERVTDLLSWRLDDPDDHADERADHQALARQTVAAWCEAVDSHLAGQPYRSDEPFVDVADRWLPYGATLLAMGSNDDELVLLQIGDGELVIGYPDGRLARPLAATEILVGDETHSLCQPDAPAYFRTASIRRADAGGWPDFVLLVTDGVSKSFRDEDGFMAAAAHFRRLAGSDWSGMLGALPQWLNEVSAGGSGDDSTLCLAFRPGAAAATGDGAR